MSNLKKILPIIIAGGIAIKIFSRFEPKVTFGDYKNYPLQNVRNSKSIATLHPAIRDVVCQIAQDLDSFNYHYIITEGYRTWKRQHEIFKEGIYTHADSGRSWHNYGLAFDIYLVSNNTLLKPDNYIVERFKNIGFTWGGDWTSFQDWGHFQKTFGYSTLQLMKKVKQKDTDSSGYVKL